MSLAEIQALPMKEKLQIMDLIWTEMRTRFESMEVSPQIKALLDERRARVERGEAQLLDWDAVKDGIGRTSLA